MAGRGDNNKRGSAGRGSSNQSNQPFVNTDNERASNHTKRPSGGNPSIPQDKMRSTDDRNNGREEDKVKPLKAEERTFDLLVDSVPYLVKVSPFTFNEEVRFHVSVNGGPDHVFTWDSEISGLRAIDDSAAALPSSVEEEISRRLQS